MSDAAESKPGMQLYTKVLLGLALGWLSATLCKALIVGEHAMLVQLCSHEAFIEFGTRWIQPIGDLFIRAIILTVVPLVFTSIAVGVYGLGDLRALGRMGGRTLLVFMGTAGLGACLASLLAVAFEPGGDLSEATRELLTQQFQAVASGKEAAAADAAKHFQGSFFQILVGLVPANITSAMSSNRELLKVILFALFFGASLTLIDKEKGQRVGEVLEGVNEAMIKLIALMMKLAPYGVFALVFMVFARFGSDILLALAKYTLVVLLALAGHLLLILLPLVRVLGSWSPLAFLSAIREVWITAFSTSSSSATLPVTMNVAETKLGVPKGISSFVLPLGATVNMDGTTIYQVVAVHFVAQVWGIDLPLGMSLTLIMVAMLMGIGAAGVPGGVIPLLYVVMATVEIPEAVIPSGIALILGMDRVLDMCRSALNVVGDSVTATVIAKLEQRSPGASG